MQFSPDTIMQTPIGIDLLEVQSYKDWQQLDI